jgi:hypothetical protein
MTNPHLDVIASGTLEGSTTGLFSNKANPAFELIEPRSPDSLTGRNKRALYKLRKGYGDKAFPSNNLDEGIMKVLIAASVVSTTGGMKVERNGKEYITNGEKPLMLKITAAGQSVGVA